MADQQSFDLAGLLKDLPKADVQREQITYVPYVNLIPDKDNGYSMDGVPELARNIEIAGLLQPLRVVPLPDSPGVYRISAGHRRHMAIGIINKSGSHQFDAGVPCIIDQGDIPQAMQELRLLLANADNRKLTPADEAQQVARVSDCLRRLEAQGYKLPGRHREWISKLVGMSKTKIARLEAITRNLIPELAGPWNEGKIPETTAYALQQLPPVYQLEAFKRMNKRGGFEAVAADRIDHCVKYEAAYSAAATCPDGEACTQHTRRLSATVTAQYTWARCTGKCCLKCDNRSYCSFPCARAAAKDKAIKEKEKAAELKRKEESKARDEKEQALRRKRLQKSAKRLLPVIEAAGLGDNCSLTLDGYSSLMVSTIRKYAAGEFGTSYLYRDMLLPSTIYGLQEVAKKLKCSTDFILGLSKTPQPTAGESTVDTAPQWQTGTPEKEGPYWCEIQCGKEVKRQPARWLDDTGWHFYHMDATFSAPVLRWHPLPEE